MNILIVFLLFGYSLCVEFKEFKEGPRVLKLNTSNFQFSESIPLVSTPYLELNRDQPAEQEFLRKGFEYEDRISYFPTPKTEFKSFLEGVRAVNDTINTVLDAARVPGMKLPNTRWEDLMGGISIGCVGGEKGGIRELTLGLIGTRKSNNQLVALTTSHGVYEPPLYDYGAPIVQPASYPVRQQDQIGSLVFAVKNKHVDCALISINTTRKVIPRTVAGIGPISHSVPQASYPRVKKMGVATFLTFGEVVEHSFSFKARFADHILVSGITEPFCSEGDSGAIVLTDPGQEVVGMVRGVDGTGKYCVVTPWKFLVDQCDFEPLSEAG